MKPTWVAVLAAAVWAAPLAGQGGSDPGDDCPAGACLQAEVALALQAAQGDVALLNAGGNDLPGNASTLGKRVGSSPRLSLAARLAVMGFEAPDVSGPPVVPAPGQSAAAAAIHGTFGLGLFRGFSPSPTMGGVLALDLLATGSVLFLPGSLGYSGPELGYGVGARVGVFRESFTLPGISVSAFQRWVQGVDLDGLGPDDGASARFGISTTSLRAVVGKDLWGIGLLGGVGWDRSSSDGSRPAPTGGTTGFSDFTNDRSLVFGGASWSYFLIQISGELGWASGWSDLEGRPSGGYDPSSGRFFGGLSVRFIY